MSHIILRNYIYNITVRINCFFSAAFVFIFSTRLHHISPNIATARSQYQAKSNRLLHCLFFRCQSKACQTHSLHSVNLQKVHAARTLKLTAFDSSPFSNAAPHFILSYDDRFEDLFIYLIPKTIPKKLSTSFTKYIGDCFVKHYKVFVFQFNVMQCFFFFSTFTNCCLDQIIIM